MKKNRRNLLYRARRFRRLIRKYRCLRNHALCKKHSKLTTANSNKWVKCKNKKSNHSKKRINSAKWNRYGKHVLKKTSQKRSQLTCCKNSKTKKLNNYAIKNKSFFKNHIKKIPQKVLNVVSRSLKMALQRFKKVLLPQEFICPLPSTSCVVYPLDRSHQSPNMRLYSFRDWPRDSAIGATRLVDNGFACIDNDQQKVECISCRFQLVVPELQERDLNAAHRVHSPDCPFANGRRHVATVLEDGLQQVLNREESSRLTTAVTRSSISDTNVNVSSSEQSQSEQADIATQEMNNANAIHAAYDSRNPSQSTPEARRQTFMYWQHAGEQDIDVLVDAGFYFTGTEDVVRCFYCDIGLAEWNNDDDPFIDHARHSPDCLYLRDKKGQGYINEVQLDWTRIFTPRRPERSQITTRLRTLNTQSWHRDQVAPTPQQLANAGFYYTGNGDTVRCHYCDGGLREWEPNDDPWVEHAKWFPFCKFVLKVKGIQFIRMSTTGTTYTPKRPELSQTETRLRTFDNPSWPRDQILQTPQQLANAGFYYTGDGDTVRCHYCDGGLREWEPNVDPWVEHARWFPFCKYVLKVKGIQFIQTSSTDTTYTPKRPELSQTETRLRTFNNPSWPRDQIVQTPQQLANAGFYYTGDEYGEGGLREWEPTEDSWVEHARWFSVRTFPNDAQTVQSQNIQENPKYPEFRSKESRYRSLQDCPKIESGSNTEMAKSGLFWDGDDECVKCFQCGKKIGDKQLHNPDVEHLWQSPDCSYLHSILPEDYITEILDCLRQAKYCTQETESQTEIGRLPVEILSIETEENIRKENEKQSRRLKCKICKDQYVSCVAECCPNVHFCYSCASKFRDCPICQKEGVTFTPFKFEY